jgi:hypothetical protein
VYRDVVSTQHSALSIQSRDTVTDCKIAEKLLTAKSAKCAKVFLHVLACLTPCLCLSETGEEGWLRYHDLKTASLPTLVAAVGNSEVVRNAANELVHALGNRPKSAGPAGQLPTKDAFVLGIWRDIHPLFPQLKRARVIG